MTKDVFISYSTKDQAAKDSLCALLDEAGIPYFLDSKDLEPGGDIQESLKQSLRDSRYTLMLVSENSLLSAWVGMETMFRLMEEYTTDKSRLICVVVDKSVLDLDFPLKMQLHFNEKREELEAKRQQMKSLGGNTKVYDVEIQRLEQINVGDIMIKVRNHLGLVLEDSKGVEMGKLVKKILGTTESKSPKPKPIRNPKRDAIVNKPLKLKFTPFHKKILKAEPLEKRPELELLLYIAYGPEHRQDLEQFSERLGMDGRVASLSFQELKRAGKVESDKFKMWVVGKGFRILADQVIQELGARIELGKKIEIKGLLRQMLGDSNSDDVSRHVRTYLESMKSNGDIEYLKATNDQLVIQKKGAPLTESPAQEPETRIPELFISYRRTTIGLQLVQELQDFIQQRFPHIKVYWDETELNAGASIKDYMDKLTQGDYIIFVISQEFLESRNCMYELSLTAEYSDYKNRIFQLRFPGTKINNALEIAKVTQFWQGKWKEIKDEVDKIAAVSVDHVSKELKEELAIVEEIIKGCGKALFDLLGTMAFPVMTDGSLDYDALARDLSRWIKPSNAMQNKISKSNGEDLPEIGTQNENLPISKSGTNRTPKNYNLKNIIKLLTNAFDATGFETFTFANFSEVYRQFVPGMSQTQRITKLVSHAESFGKLGELLEAVKEENEYQYGQCGPYMKA